MILGKLGIDREQPVMVGRRVLCRRECVLHTPTLGVGVVPTSQPRWTRQHVMANQGEIGMTISSSRCCQRAPRADQRSPVPDSRLPVMVDALAIPLPTPAGEGAILREFSGMEMTSTAQCKSLRKAPRAKLATAFLSMLCSLGVAHAATEVQMAVDNDSVMCEHFRKALVADHVATMTRDQLCQYNFAQRHAGKGNGYFQSLNWQPVPGDPVALTMKISNANYPTSLSPLNKAGDSARRAAVLSYAKIQDRHHALTIETVPFSATQATVEGKIVRIDGYLLSSRGTYCGKDDQRGLNIRRQLLAFYTDKKLSHNLPNATYGGDEADEPLEIDGKDYVVSIDDIWMWRTWPPSGISGMFSISLDRLIVNSDGKEVQDVEICQFTYVKREQLHGK